MRRPNRKEISILIAAIPILLVLDAYLMEEEVSRETRIISILKSKFDGGALCAEAKDRIVCLAEELNKYPLKLGVGREIVQSFRKAREEAFDSAKTARDKRRAFEQYYLGTSAALGAALSRVQDAEMLRPSELYQRRDFIQVCKSFLEEMKEYTERIDRTYREVGAEPNLARGELNAAFARLLGLLKGEQNRSDFHTTLDSLLP